MSVGWIVANATAEEKKKHTAGAWTNKSSKKKEFNLMFLFSSDAAEFRSQPR